MTGLKMKYFVLNPNKKDDYGRASRAALQQYASHIRKENPELCNDLMKWVEDITLAELKKGLKNG